MTFNVYATGGGYVPFYVARSYSDADAVRSALVTGGTFAWIAEDRSR